MRKFTLFMAAIMCTLQSFADGKIIGFVKEGVTSEALIGVNVSLLEVGKPDPILATTTDIDGRFEFSAKSGEYELKIEYIGYQAKILEDVNIVDNQSNNVNVLITEASDETSLKEIVIRGSAKKETISALYSEQKNAAVLSDGISADVISKSPDKNTGEVLKRVNGTTIQDNKFVIVRGMSDRFNIAMVDGSVLPSTEPNRKSFSFDIIPSAIIDNIVINKSGSPDKPGDFAGGMINILSKEIPDRRFTNISIGTGFHTATTFKDFKTGFKSSTDFFGFDDGSRQLPKNFPTVAQMQDVDYYSPNDPTQSANYLNMLNNDFSVKQRKGMPSLSFQGVHGGVFDFKNGARLGFNAGVTFNHEERIKPNIIRQYDSYDYLDNIYSYKSALGVMLNTGYYQGNSKILFKTFYNKIFDDNYLERNGINHSSTLDMHYYAFDLLQKSLFKSTLIGEHAIKGDSKTKLNWQLSYNYINNNQPDQKKVTYSRPLGTNDDYYAELSTVGKANNRLFSNMDEHIINSGVDYTLPIKMFSSSSLKFGVFEQLRNRQFNNRYFGATLNYNAPNSDAIRYNPLETLFSKSNIDNGYFKLVDQTLLEGDDYNANSFTTAGFVMIDNLINQKFRLVYGVRAEHYYVRLANTQRELVEKKWLDFLPSANFTYLLNDKTNLRLSYFHSIVRPELREMANLGYYDYELSATMLGNPALDRTKIHNLDVKYEYFPKPGEVMSASLFYKYFNNTIEYLVNAQNNAYEVNFANFDHGSNLGVELEIRKRLGFIVDNTLFNNLSFYGNMAYTYSKIQMPGNYYILDHLVTSKPLTGQSPLIVNASLGYSDVLGKYGANLLYNYIGQRISIIGQGRVGHVYELARNILDLQMHYNFSPKAGIRLTVKDLLNSKHIFFMDQNVDGKFQRNTFEGNRIDPEKDWIWQEYRPGTSIGLSFNYNF